MIINVQPDALTANLTTPATLDLLWLKGYPLDDTSNDTLFIDGTLRGGVYQNFDPTLAVYGVFNKTRPEWWGAKRDGSTDDIIPINRATNTANIVYLSKGTYKITSTIDAHEGLIGESIHYASPYVKAELNSGTIILPYGMQDTCAVFVSSYGIVKAKPLIANFGIDMANMTAGTSAEDTLVHSMTIGLEVFNVFDAQISNIEISNVPANSAGVAHISAGSGSFWANYNAVSVRTKLASDVSDVPTAKGFVLVGTTEALTALSFNDCTSYRGWYLQDVHNAIFIACHAEESPKDGWWIHSGANLTWIGGFHENQGTESVARTFYQFFGESDPIRVTLIGNSLSGNGVTGFSAANGYARINSSGAVGGDQPTQQLGSMVIDADGIAAFDSSLTVNANHVKEGYSTGRNVDRTMQLKIEDGTNANTIKCTTLSLFNHSAISVVDNIAKGATTSGFTLSADGFTFKIENSILEGTVIGVGNISITWNLTTTTGLGGLGAVVGGDVQFYFGDDDSAEDITAVVDGGIGEVDLNIPYITDE